MPCKWNSSLYIRTSGPHPRQRPLERIVMYATEEGLRLLARSATWFVDGTFSKAPSVRHQGDNRVDVYVVCIRVPARKDRCHLYRYARGGHHQAHGAGNCTGSGECKYQFLLQYTHFYMLLCWKNNCIINSILTYFGMSFGFQYASRRTCQVHTTLFRVLIGLFC